MAEGIDKLITAAQKEFGADRARLGSEIAKVEAQSTGIPSLDMALGIGGWPKGGISMIYGPESVGKSVLSYISIGEVHRQGKYAALVDLEGTFDPEWAQKFGVDPEKLVVLSPRSAEEVVDKAVFCAQEDVLAMTVVDSIGAMASERELEDDGKKQAYGQSGIITNMVKKIQPHIAANKQVMLFINQVRDTANRQGLPMVHAPGGHALHHACAVIVRLRPGDSANRKNFKFENEPSPVEVGYRPVATTEKSKVSSPRRNAEWDFYHTETPDHPIGIDFLESLVSACTRLGLINRRGAYYDIPDLDYKAEAPGRDKMLTWLKENDKLDDLRDLFHKTFEEKNAKASAS